MIDTTIMTVNAEGNAEDDSANSIVDQFVKAFEEKTKVDFWALAHGAKAGKQFMYTYCMIMAKKIPTIILLGYYEVLVLSCVKLTSNIVSLILIQKV